MGNPFVHVDLSCDDPEAAKKFYKSIFDWNFQDFPGFGGWSGLDVGQGVGGGLGKKHDAREPTAWTAYVNVDDVKKTMAKAQKAGATILRPFTEVPGMGYLAVFKDPQGAQIGLWQTAKGGGQQPAAEPAAAQKPPAAQAPAKAAAPAAAQKPPTPAAKATQAPVAAQKAPAAKATQAPSKTPPPAAKTTQAKAPPPNAKATQAPSKAAPPGAKASQAKAARPEAPSKAPAKATAPTRKPAPVMGKTGKR